MSNQKPQVLLCDGGFYGTLAAARTLGASGVRVLVADPNMLAPALWSRQVAGRLRCPPAANIGKFVTWARNVGQKYGQPVIYPTSDDVSLVLALHRSELERDFLFYQPDLDTLLVLLDKAKLALAVRAAGLDMPDTWAPGNLSEAEELIRKQSGHLLIKPRTQSLLNTHSKGTIVLGGRDESVRTYTEFYRRNVLAPQLAARFPDWTLPIVQRYHPEAVDKVYSIAGFIDRGGRNMAVRAAEKVLQLPSRLGTGLCFQSAQIDLELASGLQRLLQRIGYFGVFEAEFIRVPGRSLLIDINGRLYNQLAFDVARGLPLPTLFYEGALGNHEAVAATIAISAGADSSGPRAFCNRSRLGVVLGLRRILGTMPRREANRWREWYEADPDSVIDAVSDRADPWPRRSDMLLQIHSYLRHPRAFLRNTGYEQSQNQGAAP
jgi:predicted ATP-grasp superfamily ATP-dependent carboligase